MTADGEAGERFQQVPHCGDLVGLLVHGDLAEDRADAVRQRRDQVRGLPVLVLRAADGLAVDGDDQPPPACTALVCSQAPRTRSSTSALTSANARRKVDSSAGPRAAPSAASTSGPASAAHCPIAANDLDPAMTAAIPDGEQPASGCRRPRLFRGSGTWARRSSRYWLRAAGMGEDVIGGRVSLVAGDGERRELPSFRPGPVRRPRTRRAHHPPLRHRRSQPSIHDFAVSLVSDRPAAVGETTPPVCATSPHRLYRSSRVDFGGTTEIMKEIIGRGLGL